MLLYTCPEKKTANSDVFYDFFLGIPSIRTKRKFNKYKQDLIAKFTEIGKDKESEKAYPEYEKEVKAAKKYGMIENEIEMAKMGKDLQFKTLRVNGQEWEKMDEIQQQNHLKSLKKEQEKAVRSMTKGLKDVMRNKVSPTCTLHRV